MFSQAHATDFRSFSRCIAISVRCDRSSSRSVVARHRHVAERERAATRAPPSRNARASADSSRIRLIDALQPQQPVLEVARQRLDRHAGRHRLDHRRAQPEQRLVRVGLRRPLVDQLGEVARRSRAPRRPPPTAATASARRSSAAPARAAPARVRHAPAGHRLERPAEPPPALPRVLRHAALLAAIARQEHDDPIRLTELVGPAESARRWCAAAFSGRVS